MEDLQQGKLDHPFTRSHLHDIMEQLLRAVQAVHNRGYVHRDIKPENVLIYSFTAERIEIGLTDYGLAIRHNTRDVVVGTHDYMPLSMRYSGFHYYDGSEDLYGVYAVVHLLLRILYHSVPDMGTTLTSEWIARAHKAR